MMKAFEEIAVQQGWTEATQLKLLKDFVDNLDIPEWLLADFARRMAKEENEQE